jgi:hypothetical protein
MVHVSQLKKVVLPTVSVSSDDELSLLHLEEDVSPTKVLHTQLRLAGHVVHLVRLGAMVMSASLGELGRSYHH